MLKPLFAALLRGCGSAMLLLLALTTIAPAAQAADQDCLAQLLDGRSPQIDCVFPVAMTPDELAQVRKLTRDVLQDASCQMTISIERRLLDEAMGDPADHEFVSPPQPVACEVVTSSSKIPINFTFAPKVTFKGGVATTATPGMDNVTGVSRVLSWPVQTWVNNSGSIRKNMLLVINAVLKRAPRKS